MLDKLKNLNIDTCSDSELRALICQTLPIFLQACQKFLSEDKTNQNPCDNCNNANTCKEPCELLEALLPSKYGGSYLRSNTFGNLLDKISDTNACNSTDDDNKISHRFDRSSLISVDRTRTNDIFFLYKNCLPIFTTKEWRVVKLKIEEGDTYKIIGNKLGIAPSTASDTFQRAKKKMENYYITQKKREI